MAKALPRSDSYGLSIFHDPYLVGNGRWCSSCFPDGPPSSYDWRHQARSGCNECAGRGRIVHSGQEAIDCDIAASITRKVAL